MSDLKKAFEALKGKQERYNLLWDYYDGNHPLVYSTKRLREIFDKLDARFEENWCAVVVDAALDRLSLQRFEGVDEALGKRLGELMSQTELEIEVEDIHKAALVCGEAFVVAWKDEASGEIEAYYNDPRMCHVQYMGDNPHQKEWAAKWWVEADGRTRLNLYYADRIEYYVTTATINEAGMPTTAESFEPMETPEAKNPFGVIPVFHFRRERRKVLSELDNIITLQAAVNKLLADMMVAAEFGAFKQRYVISNADVSVLKNSPNEVWDIPAGDGIGQQTSVGEFSATELGNYTAAMEKLTASLATISKTPMHYFFKQGRGDISGEALIAMEAPLNKKCATYIKRFQGTWQRLGAFLLQMDGKSVGEREISPVFQKPETVQPRTEAEILGLEVQSGIPLVTALRRKGWSEAEIKQMVKDKKAETAEAQESLAAAMLEQQRRFDQEGSGE